MTNTAAGMPSSDEALERLMLGNQRYVSSKQTHPRQTPARRAELSQGQRPFAIVLTCSDSRVPPEVIFDQGLGDLFVIRVAGNILDDVVIGSIEYAAEHLQTPLMVVLGHSKCGAVTATVAGGELEGHLPSIGAAIQPAVERAREQAGELLDNAIRINAEMVAEQLESSAPVLSKRVEAGGLKVVAALYDIDTGAVEVLP